MSDDENEDESEPEQSYNAEMRAGELYVSAEGETTEEAVRGVRELWDKAIHDLGEMPEEQRNLVGLE